MASRATDLLYILNQTLFLLGEKKAITDFDDPETDAGIKAKHQLYEAIDEAQQQFFWQELCSTVDLVADGDLHYDGRTRFALPADCLRPLGARFAGSSELAYLYDEGQIAYDIEENFLIVGADEVALYYVKRSDDPTVWTPELARVVYTLLAANAALNITGSADIAGQVFAKYDQYVKPFAKLLQSKYRTSKRWMPRGFTNLLARYR